MRIYLPVLIAQIVSFLFSYLAGKLLIRFNENTWKMNELKIIAKYLPYTTPVFTLFWFSGLFFEIESLLIFGASVITLIIISSLLLLITLPVSMLVHKSGEKISNIIQSQKQTESEVNNSRRRFLKVAVTSLPVFALGTAGTGMARSFEKVRLPEIPFYFPDLPDDLEDFKILHFSDLHLGFYFHLSDLEDTLIRAEQKNPDLILVTGDISDNLSLLPDAMKLISELKTKYGSFSSLGNHEYIRGIRNVINIITKSPVPLLINSGKEIKIGNSSLYIGGADDPKTLNRDIDGFLNTTVANAMVNAPDTSFKLLMSHRPRALDFAPKHNVDLILSGHTHGGQVGFNNRSLFQGMAKEPYMWGKYKITKTQMYTSAGMGHWFPFRLNCPAEAPIIILKKS